MVREHRVNPAGLIQPLFVDESLQGRAPIASMPGIERLSIAAAIEEAEALHRLRINGILLFGLPATKDHLASSAYAPGGVVQQAIRGIKARLPDMLVIADLCNCAYTDHGHCGILDARGDVGNDSTLELLAKTALSYARAGADVIAPSDMMDGRVAYLRAALDAGGFAHLAIMSYAVKYASAFYGPFREAAQSAPSFGDRATYQMDAGNLREALREARVDAEEGADILIVKPAMAYLDVVRAVREQSELPIAVYNVSGEYAMVKATSAAGWIDERRIVDELFTSFTRAGASLIISYFAKSYMERIAQ
jgi:porphobilinogen synthase